MIENTPVIEASKQLEVGKITTSYPLDHPIRNGLVAETDRIYRALKDQPWEHAPSPYLEKSQKLQAHLVEWISAHLGLDVSSRTMHNWKLFTTPEANYQNPDPKAAGHANVFTGEIMVGESPREAETLGRINHELIHLLSARNVSVRPNSEGGIDVDSSRWVGFEVFLAPNALGELPRKNNFFNEAITELINFESFSAYCQQNQLEMNRNLAYPENVCFISRLLHKAAQILGKDFDELKLDIYRGYFTGDFSSLLVLEQAFGRGFLKGLFTGNSTEKFPLGNMLQNIFDGIQAQTKIDQATKDARIRTISDIYSESINESINYKISDTPFMLLGQEVKRYQNPPPPPSQPSQP